MKKLRVGKGKKIDRGVLLGYPTGRKIPDRRLEIGDHPVIRSGSVLYEGSRVGDRLQTGHNVVIREQSTLGDDVWIWSNTVVDYGCRIGSGVRIHCNCYISQNTTIEDGAFLAPGTSTANDKFPISDNLIGPVIGRNARIGVNCTILPGVRVGKGALIGAGSVVTKDIPDGAVAYGVPARVVRKGKA